MDNQAILDGFRAAGQLQPCAHGADAIMPPLAVDGLVLAAMLAMLDAARRGLAQHWLPRLHLAEDAVRVGMAETTRVQLRWHCSYSSGSSVKRPACMPPSTVPDPKVRQ